MKATLTIKLDHDVLHETPNDKGFEVVNANDLENLASLLVHIRKNIEGTIVVHIEEFTI